jgi:hypothetical protein
MLLMCDIDVNLPVYDIRAPLHAAALYGNLTALKLFLQAGARPNTLDSWHRTPLQIAVERSVNWVGPGWEARQKTFQEIVQVTCMLSDAPATDTRVRCCRCHRFL